MSTSSKRPAKLIKRSVPLPPFDGQWHMLRLPEDVEWYHLRSIDVILLRREMVLEEVPADEVEAMLGQQSPS